MIAPATRALVERLLQEHQYTRAGTRRHRRSGLVDLVFNGLDSPWAVEILRGVEDWCASHGMAVAVSAVRHGSARPASWTSALASHDTEGVILVTSELTAPQLEQLRGEGKLLAASLWSAIEGWLRSADRSTFRSGLL